MLSSVVSIIPIVLEHALMLRMQLMNGRIIDTLMLLLSLLLGLLDDSGGEDG